MAALCLSAVVVAVMPSSNWTGTALTDADMAFAVGDSSCPAGNSYVRDPAGCVVPVSSVGCKQKPGLLGFCCVVGGPIGTWGCNLEVSSMVNGAGNYAPDVPPPACVGTQDLEACNCDLFGNCYSVFNTIGCGNRVSVQPTC
jgi:hypothetical protein